MMRTSARIGLRPPKDLAPRKDADFGDQFGASCHFPHDGDRDPGKLPFLRKVQRRILFRKEGEAGCARIGQPARGQQAQILLGGEDGLGFLGRSGGDNNLGEYAGDIAGRRRVDRAIERDDAARRAHRITAQRSCVCLAQRPAETDAARVGVLDDGNGSRVLRIELRHQLDRCIRVTQVVVGQLLALVLHCRCHAGTEISRQIEGRPLMRVLPITQLLAKPAGERAASWGALTQSFGEPAADRRVVGCRARVGLGGQRLA